MIRLETPPPYIFYPNIIQLETSKFLADSINQNINIKDLKRFVMTEEMLLFEFWLIILENAYEYEAKMIVPDKYEYPIRFLMTKGNIYGLYALINTPEIKNKERKNAHQLFAMCYQDLWRKRYENTTIGYKLVNPHHPISKEEFDSLYSTNTSDDFISNHIWA